MTLFFSNHTVQIFRQRQVGANFRYTISATFTAGYPATIEPASPERSEFFGETVGHVFTGFVDQTVPVKENDDLVDENGKKYAVKGVNNWQGMGIVDHKELTLVSKDG